MSIRERWTVYPLLFMTLGIALTDKISKRTSTDTVICKNLVVTDRKSIPQVIVSSSPAGGIVQTNGRQSNVLLGHTERLAGVWYTDAKGNLVAVGNWIPAAQLIPQPAEKEPQAPPEEAPTQPQQEPEPKTGDEK